MSRCRPQADRPGPTSPNGIWTEARPCFASVTSCERGARSSAACTRPTRQEATPTRRPSFTPAGRPGGIAASSPPPGGPDQPTARRTRQARRVTHGLGRPGRSMSTIIAAVGVVIGPPAAIVLAREHELDGRAQPRIVPEPGGTGRLEHLEHVGDVARREPEPEPRTARLRAVAHWVVRDRRVPAKEQLDGELDRPRGFRRAPVGRNPGEREERLRGGRRAPVRAGTASIDMRWHVMASFGPCAIRTI